MQPVDWDNPCAKAKALRDAYMRIITGTAESEIEYLANGVNRRARYTQADTNRLQIEMEAAERECQISRGIEPTRRRHAISAGYRRIR